MVSPPGILDLCQARDWPHRTGDPIGDPALFTLPLSEGPGTRSHPCENCGQDCLVIHDNVLCWKCKGTFCFHCTTKDVGGPNAVMNLSRHDIVHKGWGTCPSCTEPLRAIALIPVFRQMIESMSSPSPTVLTRSLVLEEVDFATLQQAQIIEGGIGGGDTDNLIENVTHAINAINYHASLSPGGKLGGKAREDLVLLFNLRAQLEGDTDLSDALRASFDKFAFDGFVNVVGAKGTDASVDARAFRNLFYPLPASWRAGVSSKDGLLLVDMRANNREVALASKQFKEEKKLLRGINEMMLTQQQSMVPEGSSNDLAEEFGATRMGNVFYLRCVGGGAWQEATFANDSIKLGSVAQFVFEFDNSSSPTKFLEEGIVRGKAGDQGPPFACKVDNTLTSQLCDMLSIKSGGDVDSPKISAIKVLKGSQNVGPFRFLGVSVIAAIQRHCVRFWIDMAASSESAGVKAALSFAEKGIRYFYRQSIGYHLCCTKGALVQAALDPPHAIDLCSFCGRLPKDDAVLKRCTGCSNSRYCSTDCQSRHWKMKGPNGHKRTCARHGASDRKIFVGSRVVISDLQSESGKKMNGKEGIVLAEANADGRVELVFLSTLASIEQSLVRQGTDIPASIKKLIKVQNIDLP